MTKLEEHRQKHGIKPKDLSKKTGLLRNTVNVHLSGRRNPKFAMLVKYAKALGCEPTDLIG